MAIQTYADLKDAVRTWLNRNDTATVNAIPQFINFAEMDFQRTIDITENEMTFSDTVGTSTVIDVDNGITLPTDYYQAKHLFVNNHSYARVDVDTFQRMIEKETFEANSTASKDYLSYATESFKPVPIFCRIGKQIKVSPKLKDQDEVKLIYWKKEPFMTRDSDSSNALKLAPDVLLYLALRHSAVFLRDSDQAQFWEQKATDAGTRLIQRIDINEWSGSPITVPDLG